MSKKKRKSKGARTAYGNGVAPAFKKHIEEQSHGRALDFSNAPDEMRLSDRILRLIDPYMETMDIVILIDCATIAWNECLAEDFDVKGPYSLNNALLNYNNYRDLIDALKSRKRSMFEGNFRHIREVKVYRQGEDMSVNVASDFGSGDSFAKMLSSLVDEMIDEIDDDEFSEAVEPYEEGDDAPVSEKELPMV